MVEANRVFLSDVQVAARYAVTRATIWRWSKETGGVPCSSEVGTEYHPMAAFGA